MSFLEQDPRWDFSRPDPLAEFFQANREIIWLNRQLTAVTMVDGATIIGQDSANTIRVRLVKKMTYGLGLYIRNEHQSAVISGLVPGSDAERSQLLCPGDKIVGINGMNVTNLPFQEILTNLGQISVGNFVILSIETINSLSRLVIVMGSDNVPEIKQLRETFESPAKSAFEPHKFKVANLKLESPDDSAESAGSDVQKKTRTTNFFNTEMDQVPKNGFNNKGFQQNLRKKSITKKINSSVVSSAIEEDSPENTPPPRPRRKLEEVDTSQEMTNDYSENHNNNKRPAKEPVIPTPSGEENKPIVSVMNCLDGKMTSDTLHLRSFKNTGCAGTACAASMLRMNIPENTRVRKGEELLGLAKDFIQQYYESLKRANSSAHEARWLEVEAAIKKTGNYSFTYEELSFAIKTAWRNSPRCIGRIQWSKLFLFDGRDAKTPKEMFDILLTHMKWACNGGALKSAITLFRQREKSCKYDFRIWNAQLIKYAGYKQPDGTILGDPWSVDFTEICEKLGWKPPRPKTRFDLLPLVLQANGGPPELFEVPHEFALEVKLKHPDYPNFEKLGIKWYGLPAVTSMMFDVGGIFFPGIAFSGWYLNTEVARDLCDTNRYNLIEEIAEALGRDTRNITSLWKDQTYLDVNRALLYSYQQAKVTMVDHHSVSDSFMQHYETEQKLRGGCPGDWVWVMPPLGGSLLPVFHQEMLDYRLSPCYDYEPEAWKVAALAEKMEDVDDQSSAKSKNQPMESASKSEVSPQKKSAMLAKDTSVLILFATETGKSEKYAKTISEIFRASFQVNLSRADEYDHTQLEKEKIVLIIASTFGNGDPPENGVSFANYLNELFTASGIIAGNNQAYARSSRRRSSVAAYNQRRRVSILVKQSTGSGSSAMVLPHVDGPLNNTKYAVFGLGSSAYPQFCTFAYQIDEAFRLLGAENILPVETGDDLNAQEKAFKKWAQAVYEAACQLTGVTGEDTTGEKGETFFQGVTSWKKGRYRLVKVNANTKEDLATELGKIHNKKLQVCTLTTRQNLQSAKSPRQTIQLNLESRNTLGYQPGDHLAIFPQNDQKMVARLFQRLQLDTASSTAIKLEMLDEKSNKTWKPVERLPVASFKTLFSFFLDITTPPTQAHLAYFSTLATDSDEQSRLMQLNKNTEEYETWKATYWPSLYDVLEEFPSIEMDLTLLLTEMPILQQRYYSISSSPLVNQRHVQATVAIFLSKDGNGTTHYGVCSHYLNNMPIGEKVYCAFRSATYFHLPERLSVPIYLICAGTGIAPFRSFWQQLVELRSNEMPKLEVHLIFGCRNTKMDHIFKNEIDQLLREGFLKSFHLALSQEPGSPKTHVQQLIVTLGKKLVTDMRIREAHIYVCGEVSMAKGVWEAIEDLCIAVGGLDEVQAENLMNFMRSSNRYHEDIFGTYYHLIS